MWQGKEAKKGGRVKRLDLNLLIGQQHLNDLNISFNARPNTGGFLAPFYIQGRVFFAHTHTYLQLNIINFNMFIPLFWALFSHPHTWLSVCFVWECVSSFLYPGSFLLLCAWQSVSETFWPLLSLLSYWNCATEFPFISLFFPFKGWPRVLPIGSCWRVAL